MRSDETEPSFIEVPHLVPLLRLAQRPSRRRRLRPRYRHRFGTNLDPGRHAGPAADAAGTATENGAAGAGANVAADGATATDKNGKPANGGMYIQPGCKPVAGKDANGVYAVKVEC